MALITASRCNPARTILSGCIAAAIGMTSFAHAGTHPVFNTNDSGIGSLRQAIINANGDPAPPVVVDASTINGTITLATGQLSITSGMSIQGPGSGKLTINGNDASRIFYINTSSAQNVTISGVSITHGKSIGGGGGLLSSQASLALEDCVFDRNKTYANTAISPAIPGNGGGISASGANLLLSKITLSNNYASNTGGGAFLNSGAGGTSYIRDSVISGNTANASAGGVYNGVGSAYFLRTQVLNNHALGTTPGGGIGSVGTNQNTSIRDSTVSGNTSNGSGGGLFVKTTSGSVYMNHAFLSANSGGAGGPGQPMYGGGADIYGGNNISILNSTFSGNRAGFAAGLFVGTVYVGNSIHASVSNTTIAGNATTNVRGYGGGLYSLAFGSLTIESSTIAENSAYSVGGIRCFSATTIHNTVIANNTIDPIRGMHPDAFCNLTANFSLVRTPNGAIVGGSNNITGVDPLLGSLGNYGGPMPTKLPLPGSPLINAGDPAATTLTADQRGLSRVVGSAIDIGADERQANEDTIFLDTFEGY